MKLIDFEKARRGVIDVLRGKVSTPTAIRVLAAMETATVQDYGGDCETCGKKPGCQYNQGRHGIVRINCPLWRAKV